MIDLYGHRGAQHEAPESTVSGFRHAIAIGLTAVEFDVQRTADRQLVVIHDATLDRTTNGHGPVADLTLVDLQRLDARAQFADWPEPCTIPTLEEVLGVTGSMTSLLVEIKPDAPDQLDWLVPAVIEAVHHHGLAPKVMISSFDPYALAVAARTDPEIRRVINGAWRSRETPNLALAAGVWGTDFDLRQVGQEHIDWARQHDLWVIGWPGNSAADLARHLAFGVDAIGSDVPTAIQQMLGSRN
jgi:glycerophosphoryl diester phosphodiesterase